MTGMLCSLRNLVARCFLYTAQDCAVRETAHRHDGGSPLWFNWLHPNASS